MYFHDRHQAGRMLASQLYDKFRFENCAVVAVDEGGVIIGSEISSKLHCALAAVANKQINLPLEPLPVGGITTDGDFVYNPEYSQLDIDDIEQENRGFIEEQKISKLHEINSLMNGSGILDKHALKQHNIILTSDGLSNPFKLDLALAFIKTVQSLKLIVATPLASVSVVDWMHIYADEIYCLSVIEDYISTDHYYDFKDKVDSAAVVEILNNNILNWK